MERRTFLSSCAGGALGGWMAPYLTAGAHGAANPATGAAIEPDETTFWRLVRDQFPLQRDISYLNNGTMGPSPLVVQNAVRMELETVDRTGRYGGWEEVRPKIAGFVHALPDEISLTHNVTEGINVIACGLPLKSGDEVILTTHEHAGNALPWLARARRDRIVIRAVDPGRTAAETLNRINDALTSRTRVIAVPHITCTTGQVLPGKEISRLGHDKGLWVMLDAAHTPGMLPCDVHNLECDFFASCGHKWMMGPKGTGFLYVRKDRVGDLEPFWVGGGSDSGWDVRKGTVTYRDDAHRFDFASQSAALYAGLGAAVDFLTGIGMENVSRRGMVLAGMLRTELGQLGDRIEFLTPDEPGSYGSILGFRLRSYPFDKLQPFLLEKHRIVTRMVPENGVNCNRISTHIYNSEDEVRRVAEVITSVA